MGASMRPLVDWPLAQRRKIVGVFTDIDDTLTTEGAITPDALQALADLQAAGLKVVAITGRPVGWCAPFAAGNPDPINPKLGTIGWPVDAFVAENGSVALISNKTGNQVTSNGDSLLSKLYQEDASVRQANTARMQQVAARVLREVPSVGISRDSAGRETDLAFDYNEHARLPAETVQKVLAILRDEGMRTSVSSIHIHGCYGDFDKWRGACWIARELWRVDLTRALDGWVFVGDSGNDQAMFQHFTHSVGVANIARFVPQLAHLPRYVAKGARGAGFTEVARALLQAG
jgi:HAD superfamily hydrolase (TIGR01484 family)